MSWAIGTDLRRPDRDIGYGVPAYCDHPGCAKEIDRGLAFVCGTINTDGEDRGCGLHFCAGHLLRSAKFGQLCCRCWPRADRSPFEAKPAHPDWARHKLTDPTWAPWRVSALYRAGAAPHEEAAVRALVPGGLIGLWNDHAEREHADVIQIGRQAIAAIERDRARAERRAARAKERTDV